MLMSTQRKFVFIEVPKTGTSAIAKRLLQVDPGLQRDVIHYPDQSDEPVASSHITAKRMRELLGTEAENYIFVGFLRDPIDLLISKYFYYKVGRTREMLQGERRTFGRWIRHWSTRLLPLSIWILIYPYKSSAHFALDDDNTLLLDAVGDFKALETHFREIFQELGYRPEVLTLEPVNVSSYERPQGKFFRRLARLSLRLHAPKDLDLYSMVKDGVYRSEQNKAARQKSG